MNNHFANTFPSLEGNVVTEGHARYCRDNGHARNAIIGKNGEIVEISERCPRCGEILSAEDLKARWAVAEDLDERNALYAAWQVAVKRDEDKIRVAAARAARAEAEREAYEAAEAADAALTYVPSTGDAVTDEDGRFGIVTEPVRKAGIHKGRLGVQWAGQPYSVVERPSRVTVIPKSDLAAFLAALKKPSA